jgi:hypothetical protein
VGVSLDRLLEMFCAYMVIVDPVLSCSIHLHLVLLGSGPRLTEDSIVEKLLNTGILKPPSVDDDDRHPRAAG